MNTKETFELNTLPNIKRALLDVEYTPRDEETIALHWLVNGSVPSGTKALLIEGSPGVGKTFFAEKVAEVLKCRSIFYLFHSWTDDQELLKGVDVVAAVAGNAEEVARLGVLAEASKASQDGKVVVILDEIDKTEDRTQNLLLDWLQTTRVQLSPNEYIVGNKDNLLVCITSNATRPISNALLRRMRRLRMEPLEKELQIKIIQANTKLPEDKVSVLVDVALSSAKEDAREISLQEVQNFVLEFDSVFGDLAKYDGDLENRPCTDSAISIIGGWCLKSKRNLEKIEKEAMKATSAYGLNIERIQDEQ